jgi:serine/threonine protein kinase
MPMQPLADIEADWPRLSGLLDEIMNLPPASRETFITALPPPDDRLADTLRELLALQAKVETEEFMDDLPVFPGLLPEPLSGGAASALLSEGAEVGPYRLLRPIGEGGMGAVWLAERTDGTLKRKVALKLPRLAWAQDLATRMARERDILAGLEHPNIARLYDAGVDAVGRPWLAIEYVEGCDLTLFCDTARLDLRARVRLFLQVLEAVQYAHGNLVIHRDLKPANILVTPRGEARLLDFGIARLEEGAVEAGPDLTRTGASAMTPRYASPEQVQGARLTVASDLYSVGVVLHELLTGETPYVLRRESRAEYEQAIVESDLRVPSRLKVTEVAAAARGTTPVRIARDLRGDLDAVLLRALARAPAARYASAAAFRDDLERWLDGRIVTALPPSRLHSLRKFVARNRLAVAASAAAVLALVAVSVVAVLQAQRSESTKDLILAVIRDADAKRDTNPGMSVKDVVTAQLDERLVDQPALRREILDQLWEAYAVDGDLNGAGATTARVSRNALEKGDLEAAVKTLLQEGYYAISRDDLEGTQRRIDDIRKLVGRASLPPAQRAALHDLEGQLLAAVGDRVGASRQFSKKIEAAREADDEAMVVAGLIDRMMIDGRSLDGTAVRRQIAEMHGLLANLPPKVRVQHQVLLAIALLDMGAYADGWLEMRRVLASDGDLFAKTDYLSRRAHETWLRYCVKVGQPELALRWLTGFEQPALSHVLRTFERDPAWHLRVAEVLVADRDWEGARARMGVSRGLLGTPGARLSSTMQRVTDDLVLAEASLAIKEGLSKRSGEQVSALLISLRGPDEVSTTKSYRWAWLRGLAEMDAGQERDAIRELTEASRRARAEIGPRHPDAACIDIALVVARSRVVRALSVGDITALWRDAESTLRAALPSPHPILRYLDENRSSAQGDQGAVRVAFRMSTPRLPVCFDP